MSSSLPTAGDMCGEWGGCGGCEGGFVGPAVGGGAGETLISAGCCWRPVVDAGVTEELRDCGGSCDDCIGGGVDGGPVCCWLL